VADDPVIFVLRPLAERGRIDACDADCRKFLPEFFLQGFEEFLRRVESPQYAHVKKTPELFDRCLPYAMAFGVEAKWAKAFEGIYREPPRWYVGPGYTHFSVTNFSSHMSSFTTTAGSSMASAPRSSSGSGFGGGGSSGGGGGGGGGGGF